MPTEEEKIGQIILDLEAKIRDLEKENKILRGWVKWQAALGQAIAESVGEKIERGK